MPRKKQPAPRRKFTDAQRDAILAEVESRPEGVSIPDIAAKNDVHPSMIYYWQGRKAKGILNEPHTPPGNTKRRYTPEQRAAAVQAAIARGPGVTIDAVARQHAVDAGLLYSWIKREGAKSAPREKANGNQLALAGIPSAVQLNSPAFVNSAQPLPEPVQIALLQRNNSVLKAIVHQLLEHL